jgi:hypothetical protein
MAFPVLLLRAELTQLLTGLLGIYTFANGAVTPAVRVIEDDDPTRAQVQGLELVIARQPDPDQLEVYKDAPCEERWNLWLKDWDSSNARATEAAERICSNYSASIRAESSRGRAGPKRQLQLQLTNPRTLAF